MSTSENSENRKDTGWNYEKFTSPKVQGTLIDWMEEDELDLDD